MRHSVVAIFLFAPVLMAQDPEMLRHFDYAQGAPLDVQEAGVERRGQVAIHDLFVREPQGWASACISGGAGGARPLRGRPLGALVHAGLGVLESP